MSTHTARIQLRKRSVTDIDSATTNESSDSETLKKKRAISIETVEKWIHENEKMLQTTVWPRYDKRRGGTVLSLKCELCIRYQEKISPAFILGSENLVSHSQTTFSPSRRLSIRNYKCLL